MPVDVLVPTFSEHWFQDFFLTTFWLPLAPCWQHLIRFWCHFGSMLVHWLHFDTLKPTLRPTTPKKTFLGIVFKWSSADLCIDLDLVFHPNLYHLSIFVSTRNPKTPQPHSPTHPQTHKHKNMTRRGRAC